MQDRALVTRNALIRAAADVFARRGYAAASMSDILSQASVTKGALYFHFRSKEDLAHAIFAEDLRFAKMDGPSSGSPLQDLINASHAFATAIQTDSVARASVRLAVELTFAEGEEPPGYGTWERGVTTLLERAEALGELAPGISPKSAANVIVGSFTGLQLVSEAKSHRTDLHTTLVAWWEVLMVGLASAAVAPTLDPAGRQPPDSPAGAPG